MRLIIFSLSFFIFFSPSLVAQVNTNFEFVCGTEEITEDNGESSNAANCGFLCYQPIESLSNYIPSNSTPIKTIRIAFVIIQPSDPQNPGNFVEGNSSHENYLNTVFNRASELFVAVDDQVCDCAYINPNYQSDSRIRLSLEGIFYRQNDAAYNSSASSSTTHNIFSGDCDFHTSEVLPIYFRETNTGFTGIARSDYSYMYNVLSGWQNNAQPAGVYGRSVAHEIGHVLGLPHSFDDACGGNANIGITDLCVNETECMFGSSDPNDDECTPNCSNNIMNRSGYKRFFSPLQMARMHQTLTIRAGRRWWDDLSQVNSDYVVDGVETLTEVLPPGNIVVKPGAELTIAGSCKLLMQPGKRIKVERGGRLIIDGALIGSYYGADNNDEDCPDVIDDGRWGGVEVWGNTAVPGVSAMLSETYALQATDPGVVILKNGAVIEDARVGIRNRRLSGDWPTQQAHFGGLISAKGVTFRDCFKGVEMMSSTPINNASEFDDVFFRQEYLSGGIQIYDVTEADRDYFGITSWQVGGFTVKNCGFLRLKAGILLFNNGCTIEGSRFGACGQSIASGSSLMFNENLLRIGTVDSPNEFFYDDLSVNLIAPKSAFVEHNEISSVNHGIAVTGDAQVKIFDNIIRRQPSSSGVLFGIGSYGISFEQTQNIDFDNVIECNRIGYTDGEFIGYGDDRRLEVGTAIVGNNRGLQILKNQYLADVDWKLLPVETSCNVFEFPGLDDQGSIFETRYNNFSPKSSNLALKNVSSVDFGNEGFGYYYPDFGSYQSTLIPDCPKDWVGPGYDNCTIKNNFINHSRDPDVASDNNGCPFGDITPTTSSPTPCLTLQCLQDVELEIQLDKDSLAGGEDALLLSAIQTSPQATATYTSLSDASPYLSEQILIELSESTMITVDKMDLLKANSPLNSTVMTSAQQELDQTNYNDLVAYQTPGLVPRNSLAQLIAKNDSYRRGLMLHLAKDKAAQAKAANNDNILYSFLNARPGNFARQIIFSYSLGKGNTAVSQATLDNYLINDRNDQDYVDVMNIYKKYTLDSTALELNSSDKSELEIIANAHVLYSGQAQILLMGLDDQLFYPDFGDINCGGESTSGKPITAVDDPPLNTSVLSRINIFPNPSHSGQFTVELPSNQDGGEPTSYKIYDLSGRLQANGYLAQKRATLSIEQAPTGVYIIAIQQGDNLTRRKIVFQ